MRVIGGKWKIIILYALHNGVNRFGILQKTLPDISKQMLTTQLRELEKDDIISRKIFAEIPPRVEYTITPLGQTLFPIIEAMDTW
jgi:DNA-binding HxlR family transcriptional regulator